MDTPFKDILHTNTVPLDEDCQRIRELLAGPRKEAAQLTEEIERLHALIQELTEKRDNLNEFIDPHLALISPVRRLPHDVVAGIFAASLPPDRNAVIQGTESPLLLCHICQAWRTLALSTPRLWASLHIVGPRDTPKLHQINEAVAWWLAKSGGLPLSISIVQSSTSRREADFSILVQTLLQYASRWQRIRFRLSSYHSLRPLAALLPIDVPFLETVVFDGFPPSGAETFTAFLGTNSLRGLLLRGETNNFPFQAIPWDSLRHLFLSPATACHTVAEGLELLRRCPNLESCALAFMAVLNNLPPPMGSAVASAFPCRMPNLRQLSVFDRLRPEGTAGFFGRLELPNLRGLEYATYSAEELPILPLLNSPQHIQRLGLNIRELTSETLIACLGLLPALQELFLCADPFSFHRSPDGPFLPDFTFWTAITPTANTIQATLCPQLEVLEFTQFSGSPDQLLLEFIRARTECHFPEITQLSKVHGSFQRLMTADILPALQGAITDGLDLSLRYNPSPVFYSASHENTTYADGELLSDNWRDVW
ncbi:hypothetical protein B0H16DRAFT_1366522 [Mycena metata]|uniref:F-box domain-containing protein n=1 Tax=Mycena metata TaxID=1033252 RepID=A0AAD7JNL9_9AGAR|nr:hypothetical protein B0H16DRAFT_1366522 [Mycena metata]